MLKLLKIAFLFASFNLSVEITAEITTERSVEITAKRDNTYISEAQKLGIVSILNSARRNPDIPASNMKEVNWDPILYTKLCQFRDRIGSKWFFEKSFGLNNTIPGLPGRTHNYNGYHLTKLPEFSSFKGYDELFHDTQKNGPMDIAFIFNYRKNQRKCFKYNRCDSLSPYSSFLTCRNPKYPLILGPGTVCSWFFDYYGKMILADFDRIACIALGIPGPNTPNGQPNSFWCYARFTIPKNDVPYIAGEPCSKCPISTPKCKNKLCIV